MAYNFTVDKSKLIKRENNKGEDAPPVSQDGVIVICDGTGATGLNLHKIETDGTVSEHTSAYLGSRYTSEAAKAYLIDNGNAIWDTPIEKSVLDSFTIALGKAIRSFLDDKVKANNLVLTQKGRAFKLLPTTLAAVLYKECEDHIEAITFNVGDSRVLWWTEKDGLQQLSKDDVAEGYDAFSDLSNVSGCVSADGEFHINYAYYSNLPLNGILFATSDGFTDPVKPFQQEQFLLSWVNSCQDVFKREEFEDLIGKTLDNYGFTGKDDCSIAGVISGYKDNQILKDDAKKRFDTVMESFVRPFLAVDKECKEAMEAYNGFGAQKRKIVDIATSRIKQGLLDNADVLLPSKADKSPALKTFFNCKTFINAETIKIESENRSYADQVKARLKMQEDDMKSSYLLLLRTICNYAVKNDVEISFADDMLISSMKQVLELNEARRTAFAKYNTLLRNAKSWSEIYTDHLNPGFNPENQKRMINDFQSCLDDIIYIERDYNAANNYVNRFFSSENETLTGYFKSDLASNFSLIFEDIKACISLKRKIGEALNFKSEKPCKDLENKKEELEGKLKSYKIALNNINKEKVTEEEKLTRYKAVVSGHMNELVAEAFADDSVFAFLTGESKAEFERKIKEGEAAAEKATQAVEKKKAIWAQYKPVYELFNSAVIGAVDIPRQGEV